LGSLLRIRSSSQNHRENIAYGTWEKLSDAQIKKAARIAHAEEIISTSVIMIPSRYQGINLSAGITRLALPRAIVENRRILIFDEATALWIQNPNKKCRMPSNRAHSKPQRIT
jgi:ABC-type multidrug transport system fused ATPase/permease subunit